MTKESDLEGRRKNTRLHLVQNILASALTRSMEMGKLMVDAIDVLTYLLEDSSVQQTLQMAQIDIIQLKQIMGDIDRETMQLFPKIAFQGIGDTDLSRIYRSPSLFHSINLAKDIADSEGIFDVTSQHLLAGMLRDEVNIGAGAFIRKLGISPEQYTILARIPKPPPDLSLN